MMLVSTRRIACRQMNRTNSGVRLRLRLRHCRFASSLASKLPELPPQSKRFYLLRHGETDWNKLGKMQGGGFDIDINNNGIQQAHAAANVLKDMPLGIVASSHLQRASKTADIVHSVNSSMQQQQQQQQCHHPMNSTATTSSAVIGKRVIMPEFGEFRFGKFEGMALHGEHQDVAMKKEFDDVNITIYADIHARWPEGGESTGDVNTRITLALDKLLESSERHIAIVGHGRSNRVLLASLLYQDPLQHRDIQQGNTCINVLDVDQEGTWTAQIINYVEHIKR